ncbi:MAG: hypothetical protein HY718_12570 [Planctomycetes bacterium]|nr:hypothetical protein [Planctomycetota bacterium]
MVADDGFDGGDDDRYLYYYDPESRLTRIAYGTDGEGTSGTLTAEYRYDDLGRRSDDVARACGAWPARRGFGYRPRVVAEALGYTSDGKVVVVAIQRMEAAWPRLEGTLKPAEEETLLTKCAPTPKPSAPTPKPFDPWKLEYVPRADERCVTCQRLYDRLNGESERLYEITRRQLIKAKKQEKARKRQKAERDKADDAMSRVQAVFKKRGCPAFPARVSRGYTIYHEGQAVSRIRQRDKWWEVLWRSYRDKWESIGDLGGVVFDTAEEAATYVLDDPMGIFWR